jgi:hypothetical protein
MEWQPIETAPTDGAEVLVCSAAGHIFTAWYVNGMNGWSPIPIYVLRYWEDWGGMPKETPILATITHWMPLPTPPKETKS